MKRPVNLIARGGAALSLLLVACSESPSAPDMQPLFSGGKAAAAAQCQKGNFANVYRTDGTPFANAGDCISYAALGGELVTRRITTLEAVYFAACNDLTLGYEIDGVHVDVETKPSGCGEFYNGQLLYQIPHFSHQYVRLFLRDDTCFGWVFYEDGNRADMNPTWAGERVRIMDAGGFCEFPPDVPREVGAFGNPALANMITWRRTVDD